MQHSEQLADLAAALSKAQASVDGAKKDSNNPHFKSKYADLSSVRDACWDALTSNGLSVIQSPGLLENGIMQMTTMLLHSSGQWVKDTLSIPLQKVDAQGYGSATTYARRYSLAAFMGVAPEDDDGNAASQPAQRQQVRMIDAKQCAELRKLIAQAGTTEEAFCQYIRVGTLPELAAENFDRAKGVLAKRIEALDTTQDDTNAGN